MSKIGRRSLIIGAGAIAGASLLSRPAIATPTDIYYVGGVAVRRYIGDPQNSRPHVIMLHGGAHAGWSWDLYATYLASAGWNCHALDWYNHGLSSSLSTETFIARSITNVITEINLVRNALPHPNKYILMGHSMGGMAVLHASQTLRPRALVLMSPVVPSQVGAAAMEVPVDMQQPFPVFPYPVAKELFYPTMTDTEVAPYYAQLQPESPTAVWEATRWTISVNLSQVVAPTMIAEGELDALTPPSAVGSLATMMNARYVEWPDIGHCDLMLKSSAYLPVAQDIQNWMTTYI